MDTWQRWFVDLARGESTATWTELVVAGGFLACSIFALVQLLTMWGTRWGERHAMAKSFVLSLLVHLCLGLGWATVAQTSSSIGLVPPDDAEPAPEQRVAFRDAEQSGETVHDRSPVWSPPTTAPTIAPTRQQRTPSETADLVALAPAPTMTPELPPLETPTFAPEDVPAPEPELEAAAETSEPLAPADIAEATVPAEPTAATARPEATATQRTRRQIARRPTAVAEASASDAPTRTPTESPRTDPQNLADVSLNSPLLSSATDPQPPLPFQRQETKIPSNQAARVPISTAEDVSTRAPRGMLRGLVRDAATGEVLVGAVLRIDQLQGPSLTATTNERGIYELMLTDLPDHFAVSVSREGYLPVSRNLERAEVNGRIQRIDYELRPEDDSVIVVESNPRVHHLGNDRFEGEINSQFQHPAEGATFTKRFTLSAEQLQRVPRATVSMLVKGAQCPPRLWINGRALRTEVPLSPSDGSFGAVHLAIEPGWLAVGENRVDIQAANCHGDLDDFEFVNVQIRLHHTGR